MFELFLTKIRIPNFKIQSLGRAKRKGVGGKEFLPALASCPVANAKRSASGVPPPPRISCQRSWRAAYFKFEYRAHNNESSNFVSEMYLFCQLNLFSTALFCSSCLTLVMKFFISTSANNISNFCFSVL